MNKLIHKSVRYMIAILLSLVLFSTAVHAASSPKIYYENRVAVLMYHHIDPEEDDITISPQRFQEHMDALRDHGFHVITLREFEDFVKFNSAVPPNAVLLTFDDGYESFYTYAYPILVDHGFTATNFIIVKRAENYDEDPNFPYLSFNEMREMMKQGMTFQSHTYDQHWQDNLLLGPVYLDNLQRMETEEEYKNRVSGDLRLAKTRLQEELGTKQNMFAFPHGDYNQKLIDMGRKLGIDIFFIGDRGLTTPGNSLIYRIPAGLAYISANDLIRRIERAELIEQRTEAFPFLPPKLKINGVEQDDDQHPIIMNGESLVPLREVSNALGFQLKWSDTDGLIYLTKEKFSIILQVGSRIAQINGKEEPIDMPVQQLNNHVMVPTRWITEKLGGRVSWNRDDNAIEISSNPIVFP